MNQLYVRSATRAGNAKVGIIAAAVVVVLLIALAAWRFWPGTPVAAEEVGRPIADAFLTSVQSGKVDAAWESTSAEFKSDEGKAQFRQYVAKHPVLRAPLDFQAYEEVLLNGLKRAHCVYAPRGGDQAARVKVIVGLDGETWKVDGVFVE